MAEISIQAMIDTAIAQGRRSVEVPEGTYRFSERLLLRDAHDLVLDGHGATFIFAERRSAGISVENCHGVTLRNLTIDHDPVPFTQGAVTDIDPAGTWLDVAIDRGYDMTVETFQQNRAMHHFDAATLGFKHDGAWMGPKSVTSPRPGVFRAGFLDSVHSSRYNVETGDLFAFTAERPSHAIALVESWATRVEDITVLSSPGTGVLEVGGGGARLRYRILRGPRPVGAARDRLLSTCADGLWSVGTKVGAQLDGCEMEYVGDTGVNIHGSYVQAVQVSGDSVTVRRVHAKAYLAAGDRLLVYGRDYRLKGETVIKAVAGEVLHVADGSEVQAGDFLLSPDRVGSGAAIRNSVFREVEWEAALMRVSDGVFEHNFVDRTTGVGIWLGPEFGVYVEPDFVRRFAIRGNTFRGIGFIRPSRYESDLALGVISVGVAVPFMGRVEDTRPLFDVFHGNHQNEDILIQDNVVEGCAVCGLHISNASRVRVEGNRFTGTNCLPPLEAGRLYGGTPPAAMFVRDSHEVTFAHNRVSDLGPYGRQALVVDPSAGKVRVPDLENDPE
jgi:hypothetical protein